MSAQQQQEQWSLEQCQNGTAFLASQYARLNDWPPEETYCGVVNMKWMNSVLEQTKFKNWNGLMQAHDQEPHRYKPAKIDEMEMEDFKDIRKVWHGNMGAKATIKSLRRAFKSFLHKYPEFYHDDIAIMVQKFQDRRDQLAASTNTNLPFVDWYPPYLDMHSLG